MDQETTLALNYKRLVLSTVKNKFQYLLLGLGISLAVTLSLLMSFATTRSVTNNASTVSENKTHLMQKTVTLQKAQTYTVQSGDYLWSIATKYYGSGYKAYDIAKANHIVNPSIINEGQVLVMPELIAESKGQISDGATTKKVTLTASSYTVQKGDYLWSIAERAYGDAQLWTKIAEANTIVNPDLLFYGTRLKIPR